MGAVAHINDYKQGHYFSNKTRGDMSWNGYENNVLLRNLGTDAQGIPQFTDVAMAVGADDIIDSRGIGVFDYDHDGDLDIAVSHNPGDLYQNEGIIPGLYRNDIGNRRHWLAVSLQGTTVNRDAIGAEVYVSTQDQNMLRLMSAGSSYASQHGRRLYFGLGDASVVDRVTVRWPNGESDSWEHVQANQLLVIVQGKDPKFTQLPRLRSRSLVKNASPQDQSYMPPNLGGIE